MTMEILCSAIYEVVSFVPADQAVETAAYLQTTSDCYARESGLVIAEPCANGEDVQASPARRDPAYLSSDNIQQSELPSALTIAVELARRADRALG